MELLTEEITLKSVLILIISGLIWTLKVVRGDYNKAIDEGYKNIEFFKQFIKDNIRNNGGT